MFSKMNHSLNERKYLTCIATRCLSVSNLEQILLHE